MKHLNLFMISMIISVASFAQVPITGPSSTCVYVPTPYSDATAGGTWSCSSTMIATIGPSSGVLTGVNAGVATVTYTLPSSSFVTQAVTINATPCPITGGTTICLGGATTLTDCLVGGVWSSSSVSVAIVSGSGVATGVALGVAAITYTDAAGCYAIQEVTVSPGPALFTVTGGGSYCVGGSGVSIGLSGSTSGVSYSLFNGPTLVGSVTGTGSSLSFGLVTAAGTYTITGAGSTGCTVTMIGSVTITINPLPVPFTVTGGGSYCSGGAGVMVGLANSDPGINYQLYNGSTPVGAPIPGTGSALSFGLQTATGTYTVVATNATTLCANTMTGSVTVSIVPPPSTYVVSGGGSYCASGGLGSDIMLASSSTGVTYTLDSDGVADMTLPGTGSPLDFGDHFAGSYTVTATSGGTSCTSSMPGSAVVALGPAPAVQTVTGGGAYCSGGAGEDVGLAGSSTGINYQLYNGTTAIGAPIAGTGSTLSFGLQTAAGTYTVIATNAVTMCTSTMAGSAIIVINPLPSIYAVTGGGSYCTGGAGADIGLAGSVIGINYQIYLGGVVLGPGVAGTGSALDFGLETSAGTYDIAATNTTTGCTTSMSGSAIITITAPPVFTASASSVACDGSYALTASTGLTGYAWAPATGLSCTGCASPSCNPTATTTYTLTGTSSGCSSTATITVDGNRIMGSISPTVSGTIEVWLIQFNPSDSSISALDSQVACTSGGSQYYNFADPASGNYMVKAYLTGGTPGASGYIPTYGASSAHWYAATGVTHSSATDNMNIAMIYGTVPSGPGFIGGFVASGAGRGTSVPAPSVGMLIYLTDASGNVLTYTTTDGSGNYSFSGLANDTYIIYPEDYQYNTTASSTITLSSTSETVTNVNFKQYTNSMIIVPFDYSTGVTPVTAKEGIGVSPNPATSNLNINWENQSTGAANLVITDMLGREILKSVMTINAASGTKQVNLQGFKDGVYLLTIKGENINYSAKVLIEE